MRFSVRVLRVVDFCGTSVPEMKAGVSYTGARRPRSRDETLNDNSAYNLSISMYAMP